MIKLIIINYNIFINNKDIMSKMFKFFILIVTCVVYCIELVTMNENGNGIISRKIIGRIFNVSTFVIKYIYNFLKIDLDDKNIIKILKIGCNLDNEISCSNLGLISLNYESYLYAEKYFKKSLKINPNYETAKVNLYNLYKYYLKDTIKKNEIINSIKDEDFKNYVYIFSFIENYDKDKLKLKEVLENDFNIKDINSNYKYMVQYILYVIKALLNEINNNESEFKKFNDLIIDNIKIINNMLYCVYKLSHLELSEEYYIIIARIYFYGLSNKGVDYKKAKNIINLMDINKKTKFIKNNKFWHSEYNKIKKFKI